MRYSAVQSLLLLYTSSVSRCRRGGAADDTEKNTHTHTKNRKLIGYYSVGGERSRFLKPRKNALRNVFTVRCDIFRYGKNFSIRRIRPRRRKKMSTVPVQIVEKSKHLYGGTSTKRTRKHFRRLISTPTLYDGKQKRF